MKHDISVIVPFFNESENIEVTCNKLNDYLKKINLKVEIFFIDDGSTDDSVQKIKEQKHLFYTAHIIKLSKNYGSHAALRAGIQYSNSEYVTFLPADLQDPLDLIEKLYQKCSEGYDIVWAARRSTKVGLVEKLFSRLYAILMRKFVSHNFPKKGIDIVMFNSKIKDEINQNIESNSSLFLQILTLGFKQSSISYDRLARKAGKSKWTLSKKIKLVIDSFVAFSYVPIRFVSIIGILLSFFGFLWMLYIIIRAIYIKDLNQSLPTLIAVLMLGFGITNISLGIIAEYLWRTLDASRKRKAFIIDEIIDI
jgi:polyisoprenyl-phosphate glycosyltransferase